MSVEIVVLIAFVCFFGLLVCDVPIAFALAASGVLGIILIRSTETALGASAGIAFSSVATYSLALVPMFIMMGIVMFHAGVAEELYAVATHAFRKMPGAIGVATVAASAAFAAVTGSSAATVATIGRVSIREMRARGYSPELCAGIVASAGTLGVLIPPSIVLVIYGVLAQVSIGALLLAGILPGLISAILYGVLVFAKARRGGIDLVQRSRMVHGELSPSTGANAMAHPRLSPGQSAEYRPPYGSLSHIAILFIVVMGGIYGGVFTATEAGAIGALVALSLATLRQLRRKRPIAPMLRDALQETVGITSMLFALLFGGALFANFMIQGGIPTSVTEWLLASSVAPWLIVVGVLLIFIPLGMALDPISVMLIVVPLAAPVIDSLGYDLVWFGILTVKMIELGLITPPIGMNVFVVIGVAEDIKLEQAFRGILPFALVDLATIALLFAVPSISTFLPGLATRGA